MNRIGILGGTFNPIHIGHLVIAQFVCEKLNLKKVIFVPSYLPPHKTRRNVIAAKDRLSMVKMAVRDNKRFDVSDFEIKQGGKSYSINTLKYFKAKFSKKTKFFFIIGGDSLATLRKWKSINELRRVCQFVAVHRPGYKKITTSINVTYLPMLPELEVSSSYIRKRIASKKSIKYFVPENVIRYIEKKRLYR